jgi:hypothetical protein
MVNLKLLYQSLEKITNKSSKEVKKTVDEIYKKSPRISYNNLFNEARSILEHKVDSEQEQQERFKALSDNLNNIIPSWSRNW